MIYTFHKYAFCVSIQVMNKYWVWQGHAKSLLWASLQSPHTLYHHSVYVFTIIFPFLGQLTSLFIEIQDNMPIPTKKEKWLVFMNCFKEPVLVRADHWFFFNCSCPIYVLIHCRIYPKSTTTWCSYNLNIYFALSLFSVFSTDYWESFCLASS